MRDPGQWAHFTLSQKWLSSNWSLCFPRGISLHSGWDTSSLWGDTLQNVQQHLECLPIAPSQLLGHWRIPSLPNFLDPPKDLVKNRCTGLSGYQRSKNSCSRTAGSTWVQRNSPSSAWHGCTLMIERGRASLLAWGLWVWVSVDLKCSFCFFVLFWWA